jgi:hypothetical protein
MPVGKFIRHPVGLENSVTCFELGRRQKHRSDQTLPLNVFKLSVTAPERAQFDLHGH